MPKGTNADSSRMVKYRLAWRYFSMQENNARKNKKASIVGITRRRLPITADSEVQLFPISRPIESDIPRCIYHNRIRFVTVQGMKDVEAIDKERDAIHNVKPQKKPVPTGVRGQCGTWPQRDNMVS